MSPGCLSPSPLSHSCHIHDITFMMQLIVGVPKIMGTCAANFDKSEDHQGYLILIIALDSIHLKPYDDIAHRSGKCIPQVYTGNCIHPLGLTEGSTSREWFSTKHSMMVIICMHCYLRRDHATLSINPYPGYICNPIPLSGRDWDTRWESAYDVLCLGNPILGCLWHGDLDP